MNKFQLFTLCTLLVFITSCKSDEERTREQVIGQWELVDVTMDSDVTATIGTQVIEMTQVGMDNGSNVTMTISEDDTYKMLGDIKMTVDTYMDGELFSTEEMDLGELGLSYSEPESWTVSESGAFGLEGIEDSELTLNDNRIVINVNEVLDEIPLGEINMDMDMRMQLTYEKQ